MLLSCYCHHTQNICSSVYRIIILLKQRNACLNPIPEKYVYFYRFGNKWLLNILFAKRIFVWVSFKYLHINVLFLHVYIKIPNIFFEV